MYLKRQADNDLGDALRRAGAVVVEGPKACGKTATAQQVAASTVEVDTDPNVAQLMATIPHRLLEGPTPRLFDEWHVQPGLWNLIRRRVDELQAKGQFILTGSAAPSADLARHSGAGRFARVRMRTMSLHESGHSTGAVRLKDLVDGSPVDAGEPDLAFEDLIERMATGGWPGFLQNLASDRLLDVRDYLTSLVEVDLLSEVTHDPVRVRRLMQALARGVATEMNLKTLATDADLSRTATSDYLQSLARIFATEDQPAWPSRLRSHAMLRKEPKRHLADPSLAVAALQASPDSLMRNLEYAGQLFESQVVHDLLIYSGQTVCHARDNTGAEVDAVIEFPHGVLVLVEVKLGWTAEVVDQAAASLARFAAKVDAHRHPHVRRVVITGGGYSFQRTDGTYVVALAALQP